MTDSGKVISMIKMKRIFAAASAVVMAAGVFTSCRNTDSSSKAENGGSSHVAEKGEMLKLRQKFSTSSKRTASMQ